MNAIFVSLTLLVAALIWYFSQLPRHYSRARKVGLPIHFSPFSPDSPAWIVISALVGYNNISRIFSSDRVRLSMSGFEYYCRYTISERWGDAFVLLTPRGNTIFISDPELANNVLLRTRDFDKDEIASEIMSVFGPNLVSVGYEEWKRHRRIVAPALNERIMSAVWAESSIQALDMMQELSQHQTANSIPGTTSTLQGLKTITINVIGSVCFGAHRRWTETSKKEAPPAGFATTFIDSILTVVDNMFPTVFLSARLMQLPFMPKSMQEIGLAKIEFPRHLRNSIEQERSSPSASTTLLNSLVKLADQDRTASSKVSTYLSEDEITGNLYTFTIAGFDTTANTLAYAMVALAARPELQDWLIEGIDEANKICPGGEYSKIFPLLTRCLALMFETLRLYTPVPHVARCTYAPQQIGDVHFPPQTLVQVSSAVIHVSPKVWGKDALSFKPDRWLNMGTPNCETLVEPGKGTFLPWSGGPRYCPGMKMAQVEFVAVVREIFSKWKVEAVEMDGETPELARRRLSATMVDSVQKLTLQIQNPQNVVLRWAKRN